MKRNVEEEEKKMDKTKQEGGRVQTKKNDMEGEKGNKKEKNKNTNKNKNKKNRRTRTKRRTRIRKRSKSKQ